MKKVSAIIPVWNPGPGIDRCIASLRSQTLQEIEMIFIDDRGTDDSMVKVQAAAEMDPRIRIIVNPENIGPGPSRNRGIDAAEGTYLAFIDPDDYIEPEYLEILYNAAMSKDLDIVKGSVVYEKEDGSVFVRDQARNLNQKIRNGIRQQKPLYMPFTYEHHNALYRRRMIIEADVRYGTSRRAQDTTFLLQACSHADSFELAETARYHFCERSDSAMHKADRQMLTGIIDAFKEQTDYVVHKISDDPYAGDYVLSRLVDCIRESSHRLRQECLESQSELIIEDLRSFVSTLPYNPMLQERSFSVKALQNYHTLLPSSIYKYPWEHETADAWIDLLTIWSDFLVEHKECIYDSMNQYYMIYQHAWSACQTLESDREAKKREVRLQIKRLPGISLLLCKAYKPAAKILPSSVVERITKMLNTYLQ